MKFDLIFSNPPFFLGRTGYKKQVAELYLEHGKESVVLATFKFFKDSKNYELLQPEQIQEWLPSCHSALAIFNGTNTKTESPVFVQIAVKGSEYINNPDYVAINAGPGLFIAGKNEYKNLCFTKNPSENSWFYPVKYLQSIKEHWNEIWQDTWLWRFGACGYLFIRKEFLIETKTTCSAFAFGNF